LAGAITPTRRTATAFTFLSATRTRVGIAEAKTAYQDFTLWEAADPDIPILKEAKAEYAKLQ
jgi:hypothetical protein